MIDQETLDKYKDTEDILYPVTGGGNVVGQEISDDNRLVYIIKKEDSIFAAYAENTQITPIIKKTPGIEIVVNQKE